MTINLPHDFDPEAYLEINPDVQEAGVNPAEHYIKFGRDEGRGYKREGQSDKTIVSADYARKRLANLIKFVEYLDSVRKIGTLDENQVKFFNQYNRDLWVKSKAADVAPGSLVLDVGAGTCPYRPFFAHCLYKTADFKKYDGLISPSRQEGLYGSIDYVCDITDIPVDGNSFDCVISTEVIEHVPEPIKAIQEMARILKPRGDLFVTAPLGSGLHQEPYHFYGGYTPYWYEYVAKRFGLELLDVLPNRGSFSHIAQESVRLRSWLPRYQDLVADHVDALEDLFGELLPRLLSEIDNSVHDYQFTVGYHVHMRKN